MNLLKTTTVCTALILCGCPEQENTEASGDGTQIDEASNEEQDPNNQSWRCTEDCVKLTGTLSFDGIWEEGWSFQLDFMVIAGGDAPPERKHAMPVNQLGEGNSWEVLAPIDEVQGIELTVVGFIDLERDGPSDGDPAGFSQQVVSFEVIEGEEPTFGTFEIEVMTDPDICEFPGGNFGAATCDETNSNNPFQNTEEDGSTENEDSEEEATEEAPTDGGSEASSEDDAPDQAPPETVEQ